VSWRPPHPGRLIASLIAFAALAVVLSIIVVSSVLNLDTGSTNTYYARFSDASGLRPGAEVKIAGINVGTVRDVSLDGTRGVRVTFTVRKDRPISTATEADVRYANLIGTRYIALTLPDGAGAGAPLAAGDTIPLARTKPAIDLTAVFNGFQPLFDALTPGEINQLTGSIIAVFQGESSNVSSLVQQIGTITANLAERKTVISSVISNLSSVLTQVNTEGKSLGEMIGNFNTVVSDVADQRQLLSKAITAMARFTNSAADLTKKATPAINGDIVGVAKASSTLVANQRAIDDMLHDAPTALSALDSTLDNGSYVKVYLCNLDIETRGTLNLSLVPGLPAPQTPNNVALPSGPLGDPSQHSEVCR